ncbi:MAG TPA: TonB-dependent receptor plug domain-containing protein, partial [Novosphingobium sp.]|nr:TonB-dependent receptor plug domain-containing protein [Novosphingobium sp.]
MYSRTITAFFLAGAAALPSAVEAQSAPQPAPDVPQPNDIVVTALRRASGLEQTPAAITALNTDAIKQNDITNLQDLQQIVPGLVATTQGAGLNQLSLRGVRSSAGDQLVGLYYD